MLDDYKDSTYYKHHDHNDKRDKPNKFYQVHFAEKINSLFLKQKINEKLKKLK